MPTHYEPTVKGAPEDLKPGEPSKVNKEYTEIIKSDVDELDPSIIKDNGAPVNIVYYCADCEAIVKPKRMGKKFRFSCEQCKGKKVAFGTEKSVKNYYKIREAEKAPQADEEQK